MKSTPRVRVLVGRVFSTVVVVTGALVSGAAAQTPPAAPAPEPPHISQDVFVTASIAPVSTADVSRDVAVISRMDSDHQILKI